MSKSREIHRRLGHPVIDTDGHMWEFEPLLEEYLREAGGPALLERSRRWIRAGLYRWYDLSPEERKAQRVFRPPWWGSPAANTRDLATAMLPKLYYERLEEFGIDFAIVYPTLGAFHAKAADAEVRATVCRAINTYYADVFRPYGDRMTPVALIPLDTPEQGIAELEHAVNVLGLKVILIPNFITRPVPAAPERSYLDGIALDSAYDYDPFWAKCVELKVAPTAHLAGHYGTRLSPSSYVHNHIGLFASSGEAFCKALFLGGVTRRFPSLRFAFLEGGVGWACTLFADLVGHWQKRNRDAVQRYNPERIDRGLLRELCERYGGRAMADGRIERMLDQSMLQSGWRQDPSLLDEWAQAGIERAEDIRDRFVPRFYFGCEGEDAANAWAFDTKKNPFGSALRAIYGSDLGHWDVPDMSEALEEAYESVEHGVMTEENFRDFVFANPARLHAGANRDFFRGTVVERPVAALLDGSEE